MPKLSRACAALGLALLAAAALGTAGPGPAAPAPTRIQADEHDTVVSNVNNTGSDFKPPAVLM
ncbi:hypothetical protein ACWEPM_11810 [Streptomyces sp. NPDC004244]|uniref:hypothetical protein n=1 Tax=Streptomyces sp. NPDC101206 TaxID=3366128 RepID=UPI003805EA82